jgi:hypothetical protein
MWIPTLAIAMSMAVAICAFARGTGMTSIEALGAALRNAPAWQGSYRQEYVAAGMTAGEEIDGEVTVAWPDRALFRAGTPVQQVMGLEGHMVRLVDFEVPSCDDHQLDDDEWARVPLAAVLDPAGSVESFTVLDRNEPGFILVPRQPGGVDRVEVVLGSDDLPALVIVVDPQGAINRLTFADWRKVDRPGDSSWLPDPPPGIECVADDR